MSRSELRILPVCEAVVVSLTTFSLESGRRNQGSPKPLLPLITPRFGVNASGGACLVSPTIPPSKVHVLID